MYADIVVLTYQSPDIPHFTYKVPEHLAKMIKVGQLVEVPFGSRNPNGLVIATRHSPLVISQKARIKEISNILISQPILLPYQIELLKWISKYYLAPMVNCLEVMIPKIPSKLLKQAKGFSLKGSQPKGQTLDRVTLGKRSGLKPSTQTIVLVPTIKCIAETLAQFQSAKNYIIYHNELKLSEKFATWMKILSGDVDYIFGSRSAIFAPCPNLGEIIINNEHDHAYKDERSPYFDTLTIAEKISSITSCKLKIIDIAPKIQTYFSNKSNISMSTVNTREARIIDMQKERLGENFSPLALESEEFLQRVARSKKNALVYLNKKKESGHLFCKNCKENRYLEKQPEVCPTCNSPDFFFNALNIFSLAKEIKTLTPGARVNLIYQNSQLPALGTSIGLSVNEVERSILNPQLASTDIATSYIFYAPILKKYELVIFTLADTITSVADFTSEERLYQTISKLKSLLVKSGLLVVQTYNPNQPTIIFAAKNDYKSFYNTQLPQRKLLTYPPFSMLIKLTVKGKDAQKLESKAQEIINNLRLTINNERLTILGPYKSIFWQKVPACHIILKYKLGSYSLAQREKAVENLQFLRKLKDVQITVEPESLN